MSLENSVPPLLSSNSFRNPQETFESMDPYPFLFDQMKTNHSQLLESMLLGIFIYDICSVFCLYLKLLTAKADLLIKYQNNDNFLKTMLRFSSLIKCEEKPPPEYQSLIDILENIISDNILKFSFTFDSSPKEQENVFEEHLSKEKKRKRLKFGQLQENELWDDCWFFMKIKNKADVKESTCINSKVSQNASRLDKVKNECTRFLETIDEMLRKAPQQEVQHGHPFPYNFHYIQHILHQNVSTENHKQVLDPLFLYQ